MPLYEYQCESCGERVEKIQKFSDPPLETCPKCGGPMVKLFSSPAIQFKGSGFYITDYARKPEQGERGEKSEKGGKPEGGDKPAGGTTPAKTDAPAAEGKAPDKPAAKDPSKS